VKESLTGPRSLEPRARISPATSPSEKLEAKGVLGWVRRHTVDSLGHVMLALSLAAIATPVVAWVFAAPTRLPIRH
jgi:hypothetical protein